MTNSPSTQDREWGGNPIAQHIADVRPRQRLVTSGRIVETKSTRLGVTPTFRCLIDDGTGRIALVFVGRDHIPGVCEGVDCLVEGTVRAVKSRLEIWNPIYSFIGRTKDQPPHPSSQ
jgi:hypothetical protein